MSAKSTVKALMAKLNVFAKLRRKNMQKALKNTSVSFLCPNCIGGILFHDLGLQFRSPTVNLMMDQKEFCKFACNLEHYLSQPLSFYEKPGYTCPCAYLDDVTIHFTHYATPEIAAQKWEERKKRIDWDNLFIFLSERDGLNAEDILRLGNIPCKGLVVFTANAYPDIPYAYQISKYAPSGEVGNILRKSALDESREYEHLFDFVKWFNEAQGQPFDVSPFIK